MQIKEYNFLKGDFLQISKKININVKNGIPQCYQLISAHGIVCANKDRQLQTIFKKSILLCDSKPLSIFLRYLDSSHKHVRGIDLLEGILNLNDGKINHIFFGSTPETLELISNKLNRDKYCNIRAEFYSPSFSKDWLEQIEEFDRIFREKKNLIVWVGLGAPKQYFSAQEISFRYQVTTVSVGAAFNFFAGNLKRSPYLVNLLGLEWLYRWIQEPRRLASRYLVGNSSFIFLLIKNYIGLKREKHHNLHGYKE
jgi:exopolysaccharide biosynthesis WecB/TagA/CpsF family protein